MKTEKPWVIFHGDRMSVWERRAQQISWAVGQVMCMSGEHDEWYLRVAAAEYWETRNATT